jgi:hypothetical protein
MLVFLCVGLGYQIYSRRGFRYCLKEQILDYYWPSKNKLKLTKAYRTEVNLMYCIVNYSDNPSIRCYEVTKCLAAECLHSTHTSLHAVKQN